MEPLQSSHLLLGSWKEVPCLVLAVKEFPSGVSHFFKIYNKEIKLRGRRSWNSWTSQHKLNGIARVPQHKHGSLAGIPGPGRTGVCRVGVRIGCEDGFVLGDSLFHLWPRAPSVKYLHLQQASKTTDLHHTVNQADFWFVSFLVPNVKNWKIHQTAY